MAGHRINLSITVDDRVYYVPSIILDIYGESRSLAAIFDSLSFSRFLYGHALTLNVFSSINTRCFEMVMMTVLSMRLFRSFSHDDVVGMLVEVLVKDLMEVGVVE